MSQVSDPKQPSSSFLMKANEHVKTRLDLVSIRRSKIMIKNATITSKKNHVVQKSITIIA